MQTFLPYQDFRESAKCLDMRRLGKQRVEAWQIYRAITLGTGWKNHPTVRMWRYHQEWLLVYGITICDEWVSRGYKDTLRQKMFDELLERLSGSTPEGICGLILRRLSMISLPKWLGDNQFHASHRSNLLRKDPVYYNKFGWKEPNNLPYIWPGGL